MKPTIWKRLKSQRGLIVSLVVFALILGAIFSLTGEVGQRSEKNQLHIVRDAVKRATVTCYAVEGCYPPTLDHLERHYGLAFDANRYAVVYDAFASNIMPSIRVIAKEGVE